MGVNASSTGQVNINNSFNIAVSEAPFGTYNVPAVFLSIAQSMTVGSGANQFNFIYLKQRTVTSGTADSMDLTTGLSCPDGTAIVATDVVGLFINNPSTNTANILLGDAASSAWSAFLGATGVMTLIPGATLALFAPVASGYAVDSSHKAVAVNASTGTAVPYNIMIITH